MRLPEHCHAANIAGLELINAKRAKKVDTRPKRVDNRPTEAQMIERLRALENDPAAQLMMYQLFTADMSFEEEMEFFKKC